MFSISPEVDLFVMKTVQKVMNRFRYEERLRDLIGRYVVVEPNDSKLYEVPVEGTVHSVEDAAFCKDIFSSRGRSVSIPPFSDI